MTNDVVVSVATECKIGKHNNRMNLKLGKLSVGYVDDRISEVSQAQASP